ncbi:STAS domain-containing protein [Cellulomonas sp. ES6]|uniref:STAS domain-containing protein n=1 Tax=Cellulomonas sp. ES6 TaxID=3039384 RepID=UPI001990645D|nr:STAS domain-containing protein [Cellulomonas sp. ES6]MBD3779127.1 STAS domain-containing protein [Micrococcales bacterium]WHP17830.1 STAS domain-containing protein [Cellulomonas sp. ES6]
MRSTITTERTDGVTTVRLVGEIDLSLRAQATAAVDAVRAAAQPVVLDLAGVTFIDSSGVSFLLQCRKACARDDLPFRVQDVPPRARRVLEVLGLVDVLAVG